MTITKEERKACWIDGISEAFYMANKAIEENPDDSGTCNMDYCTIKKEKYFTYAETIAMFEQFGLRARKEGTGYIAIWNFCGQADRNTRWVKTFVKYLNENGFKAYIEYRID
jgi:hypothetical protein